MISIRFLPAFLALYIACSYFSSCPKTDHNQGALPTHTPDALAPTISLSHTLSLAYSLSLLLVFCSAPTISSAPLQQSDSASTPSVLSYSAPSLNQGPTGLQTPPPPPTQAHPPPSAPTRETNPRKPRVEEVFTAKAQRSPSLRSCLKNQKEEFNRR